MSTKHQIALLKPILPTTEHLLPWLKQIDQAHWYSNFGPLNHLLQSKIKERFFDADLVTTSSGTSALELSLGALDLPPASRVLVPAFTFPATITAILRNGLTPVLSDINLETWQLTTDIAYQVAANCRIDAILPVATFGVGADAEAWDAFNQNTGIQVIVDAAGALGNQKLPDFCHLVFSMHATKSFSTGEGGLVVSKNSEFISAVAKLSNFGINHATGIVESGNATNAKLSEYHAAIGLAGLEAWEDNVSARIERLAWYLDALSELEGLYCVQKNITGKILSLFNIKLNDDSQRETLESKLFESNIETRRWYYPLIPEHSAFESLQVHGDLPAAKEISKRTIGLPFHLGLSKTDIERVVGAVKTVLSR